MYHQPAHSQSLSQRLSQVLDDIGVNNDMIRKRRDTVLTEESLKTVAKQLEGMDVTTYHFGSRTEGTTTTGLNPDSDTLVCNNKFRIIQDLAEWRQGYINLLMVRDSNTPPGYCLLQKTYENNPIPVDHPPSDDFHVDNSRRVLMRNDWFEKGIPEGGIRHGPSQSIQGLPGFADNDLVHAYPCKSWPNEARTWTETRTSNWPPEETRQQVINDGCFVVPVGSRCSENTELQWRISTCLTERRLMFSLNLVQIRCYVLMKMIIKSYQNLNSEDALSSFICKTVLLHCIEKEGETIWQDDNLLGCLNICLKFLYDSISLEHCPHFIIRENNLLARRFSPDIKPQILAVIHSILESEGKALMEIKIDQLGRRLTNQFRIYQPGSVIIIQVPTALEYKTKTSGHLLYNLMSSLSNFTGGYLSELTHEPTEGVVQKLSQSVDKLTSIHFESIQNEQIACELLSRFLYMTLGSVLVSQSISESTTIPQRAFTILEQGSANDFSSSVKQVSVCYCRDDMEQADFILYEIERKYNLETLQSTCCCFQSRDRGEPTVHFQEVSVEGDIKHVLNHTAFCVRYLPSEVNCVPDELKHEYFRSESSTYQFRGQEDYWMEWAVVDSIPFFYFLRYKVYSHKGITGGQVAALDKLKHTIDNDGNLGHKETALNLLGQCKEQEYWFDAAEDCYKKSIDLRPADNAANSLCSQLSNRI